MPLHHFFSLLESRPELSFPSHLLATAIGPEAEEALCQARVLEPKGPATWYPCVRRLQGCRRTVAVDGAQLHLLCGRPSTDCATEIVPADEFGQHALEEPALLVLLQRLFGVAGQPTRAEGRGQPILLGRLPEGDCEVWVWLRPCEPAFAVWMGDLESRTHARQHRRALVLVPTHKQIYAHTFERYGPGQPVEVVHLARALAIDGGDIIRKRSRTPQGPCVPWTQDPAVDRQGTRLRVPPGVRWSHITIEYVNDDTVSVRIGAASPVRLSAADFGIKRELGGKAPLWELLLALCAGDGVCSRSSVSAHNLGALRTRATRLSKRLCAVFGIADAPLHVDSETQSVRADFIARSETRRASTRRPPS